MCSTIRPNDNGGTRSYRARSVYTMNRWIDRVTCWLVDRKEISACLVRERDARRAMEAVAAALLADNALYERRIRELERERDEMRQFLEIVREV